jgi:hypothetical protein
MKSISLLVIISLIFVSCASYTRIKKLPLHEKYEKEINYLGKDHSGKITLNDDQIISSMKMFTTGDSLKFLNKNIAHYDIVSLKDVKMITFKDHTIGFFYGLIGGFGLASGFGYVSIDWDTDMAGLGMLYYMGAGILIGSMSGGLLGSDLNYIFDDQDK